VTSSPEPTQRQRAVVAALVGVQVSFGLHYLASKVLLVEIPPRAWALLRVAGAALVMLVATRLLGARLPTRPRDLATLAGLAVFGVGINQLCFIEGLSRTTPTHSSLINTSIPVLTLLLAALLGRETLRTARMLAMALAFSGVVLILRPWDAGTVGDVRAGDLLTLVNATSYSFFLVLSRPVLRRMDSIGATTILLLCGTLFISFFGLPQLMRLELSEISMRSWLLGAFVVLFPTAGAYLASYWALQRVESSTVASFIFLQPLIASSLSALLLGERPGLEILSGGVLIFAGVYGVLRSGRR